MFSGCDWAHWEYVARQQLWDEISHGIRTVPGWFIIPAGTVRPGARTRCDLCQALQAAFGATWGYSCLVAGAGLGWWTNLLNCFNLFRNVKDRWSLRCTRLNVLICQVGVGKKQATRVSWPIPFCNAKTCWSCHEVQSTRSLAHLISFSR